MLWRDKEKGGVAGKQQQEEETRTQLMLGCKFAPCATQGSPCQHAGASVPWRGEDQCALGQWKGCIGLGIFPARLHLPLLKTVPCICNGREEPQ